MKLKGVNESKLLLLSDSMLSILKEMFLPTTIPIPEIISKYVYLSDETERKKHNFNSYIHDLARRLAICVLSGLLFFTILTWPTDFLYLEDMELIKAYLLWRVFTVNGVIFVSFLRMISDFINNHFLKLVILFSLIEVFVTGYIFAGVSGFQDPWFYAIYFLPVFTIFVPVNLYTRIFMAFSLPITWFGAFIIHHFPDVKIAFPGIRFNLVVSIIVISIVAGHFSYAILRENYFMSLDLAQSKKTNPGN